MWHCHWVKGFWCFSRFWCLCLQGLRPWYHDPLKCQVPLTQLHSVTSRKTWILSNAAARTQTHIPWPAHSSLHSKTSVLYIFKMLFQFICRLALISQENTNVAACTVFLSHSHKRKSSSSCHEPNRYPTFTIQCAQQHIHINPMQYSPSSKADSSSASQEIPLILQTRGLIPCSNKCLSLVPILSQIHPFSHLRSLRSILIWREKTNKM